LGISAFVWFAAQLFLAAKPFGLDKILGVKNLLRLHGTGAIIALAAAESLWYLKIVVQQNELSLQTLPGFLAMNIFLLGILGAILFMGNHFPAPGKALKGLRDWLKKNWGWTYKGLRAMHSLMVVAVVLMGIHVLMAFSTQQSLATVIYMATWLGLSLAFYIRYRIKNRQ